MRLPQRSRVVVLALRVSGSARCVCELLPLQGAGPHGAAGAPPPQAAAAPPPRKKRKSKFASVASNGPPAPVTGRTVVIAIDPGRKTLVCGGIRFPDGSIKKVQFSRKAYYHGMGKAKADARRATWLAPLAAAHAAPAGVSTKVATTTEWIAYLQAYTTHRAQCTCSMCCHSTARCVV